LVTNIFGNETFLDPASPQSQAREWLVSDSVSVEASVDQVLQRFALVTLYFSTNGATWAPSTWLVGQECGWHGIECNSENIVSLSLDDGGLTGTIPAEIGVLWQLQFLDMSDNALTGTIPLELGYLTNLQNLNVKGNALFGTIPVELIQLSELQFLSLDNNDLSGSLPTEGDLSQIEYLTLANNTIGGTIPTELGSLPLLRFLDFSGNEFSGSIPTDLGNLSQLQYLSILNNNLLGTVPELLCDNAFSIFSDCETVACTCGADICVCAP
jgi:Leucine-rich repeat (LRR) protein